MRDSDKTKSVQYLTDQGISYKNAHRIIYLSKGTAAKELQKLLPEYLRLKAESQRKP